MLRFGVRKADLKYAVTVKMIRKASGVKASSRTILKAFRARGVKFRVFRSKPRLQLQDVKDRLAFLVRRSPTLPKYREHA